jgi:murein DD-endopeptidase MepM/ murein hydrolase activator NlpD
VRPLDDTEGFYYVTDELQRPAGELPASPAVLTGSLEALGFTRGEVSSNPAESSLPVSTPAASIVLPASEVVATSRRALREAERASARRAARPAPRAESTPVIAPATEVATEPAAFAAGRRSARVAEHAAPAARVAEHRAPSHTSAARPAPRPTMRHGVHPSRVPLLRRIARRALPPTVMLAVAGLLIGTTVPANALFRPGDVAESTGLTSLSTVASAAKSSEPAQVLEMSAAATAAAPAASRDDWTVTSYAEQLRAKYGNRNFTYSTSGTGAVRWPFPFATTISSGYGDRVAPCRGCSSYHRGTDFTPGYGTPIQAVADGVVSDLQEGWSYGTHVFIDHVVNGQKVTTLYAHMESGSSPLVPGQVVAAGDFVGLVGNTGASTGPHLHLEVRLDGVPVDPFAWLTQNAS